MAVEVVSGRRGEMCCQHHLLLLLLLLLLPASCHGHHGCQLTHWS
jgi:hypothetical protein